MTSNNPLVPIYRAFEVASDCFKVAQRTIDNQHAELIVRTQFVGATPEQANSALQSAVEQASDLAILALFATFERAVIEHLQTANQLLAAGHPEQYSSMLAIKFKSVVEYWRIDEILDLFKGEVDGDLIGRAKQIKKYRDWIAHRNPNKAAPPQATPAIAFEVLTDVIDQIRATHTPPAEAEAGPAEPQ